MRFSFNTRSVLKKFLWVLLMVLFLPVLLHVIYLFHQSYFLNDLMFCFGHPEFINTGVFVILTIEVLGWSYIFLTRFTFFVKIQKIVIAMFILGYFVTWIFGIPAAKKVFPEIVRQECQRFNVHFSDDEFKERYWFNYSFPIFPSLVLINQRYQIGGVNGKGAIAIYFWNGLNAKLIIEAGYLIS